MSPRRAGVWREQTGHVLYMTVLLMALLTAFTLFLANVIYLAGQRIKVQNAADQLALSAAAGQARLLNQLAKINREIEFVGLMFSRKRLEPYTAPEQRHFHFAQAKAQAAEALITNYNAVVHDRLDRLARENGISGAHSRYGLWPDPLVNRDGASNRTRCQQSAVRFAGEMENRTLTTGYEPEAAWRVQARVELRVQDALIGGRRLGFKLPDLAAAGAAEVFDRNQGQGGWLGLVWIPASGNHAWDVRLAPASAAVDQQIRSDMQRRGSAP